MDLVRLPDGSQSVVDRGHGADFVATWREQSIDERAACAKPTDRKGDERQSQEQYLAAYADYERALSAWRSELARDLDNALSVIHAREIKTRLGPSRPQPPQHPDGEAVAEAGERAAVPWPEVEETSWWLAIGPLPDQRASLAPGIELIPPREGGRRAYASRARRVDHHPRVGNPLGAALRCHIRRNSGRSVVPPAPTVRTGHEPGRSRMTPAGGALSRTLRRESPAAGSM